MIQPFSSRLGHRVKVSNPQKHFMQKQILTLVSVVVFLLPVMATAQGTLQVSNLGQTPTGSAAIGGDAWIAQSFDVYSGTYTLDSVQLLMNPASGNPGSFTVSIYTSIGAVPSTQLGSLSGSSNPSSSGIYPYTASGITISPGPLYYVVVTAATPMEQGSYNWSAAHDFTQNGSWYINDIYFASSDGSTWTPYVRQNVFQMAIYATAVPEPSTLALAAFGLACLCFWRRKP